MTDKSLNVWIVDPKPVVIVDNIQNFFNSIFVLFRTYEIFYLIDHFFTSKQRLHWETKIRLMYFNNEQITSNNTYGLAILPVRQNCQ